MRTGFFVSHKSLLSPHTKEELAKGYSGFPKETMKRQALKIKCSANSSQQVRLIVAF